MKKITSRILSILLAVLFVLSGMIVPTAAEVEEIDDISDLGGNFYFQVETDKDMFSYMPGDSVIFTAKLFRFNQQFVVPYLLYTVERDDGTRNSGKVEPDSDGNYIIADYTMDRPGYVRLLLDFPDKNGNKSWSALKENQKSAFEGGVLVDAENITSVNEMPDDYVDFWIDSLTLLDDYSPDPLELKLVVDGPGYNIYEVYINCYGDENDLKSGDTFAAGYLNVPKTKKVGALPLKMSFQGYGIKGASKTASTNAIVLNMSAHSLRLGADSYGADLFNMPIDESSNYGWSQIENRDRNNVYFRNMFLRNVQAARFLMKYFGDEEYNRQVIDDVDTSAWKGLWNGKDLEASGGSQGGFQSIALGALCPQVTLVKANVPWGANQGAGTYSNPTGTVLGSSFSPLYAPGLDYHDSAFFATMLNCDIVITGGMGDMTCSPANLMMIYNNAKRGKNINASITLQQGETHMFKPDPKMIKSSLAVYKDEVTDWSIEDGVLNVSCNGTLSAGMAESVEWNKKMSEIKEINVYGNLVALSDNVFALTGKTKIYLKVNTSAKISEKAFGDAKNAVVYLNAESASDDIAEPSGMEFHTMGDWDQQGVFTYALEGDTLKIYSQDRTATFATTSGDTTLVNFAKNNAESIKAVEIYGEFASYGNMQPVFSKLTAATSVKIDRRINALSDEKNFMGMSSLVSVGHYDFVEDKPTTYTEGKADLTGFDVYVETTGTNGVPSYILSGCKSLTTVVMPGTLMCGDVNVAGVIGEKAFADCSALETVEFPAEATLTSMAFGAFSKCTSLRKVIIKGAVAKNFSCVINISKLQSFAQVPETAVFEVGSDEFADIINAKLADSEIKIKAISNGSYKAPEENKNDGDKGEKKPLGGGFNFDFSLDIDFGSKIMVVVIAVSVATVAILAVVFVIVFRKKKK